MFPEVTEITVIRTDTLCSGRRGLRQRALSALGCRPSRRGSPLPRRPVFESATRKLILLGAEGAGTVTKPDSYRYPRLPQVFAIHAQSARSERTHLVTPKTGGGP